MQVKHMNDIRSIRFPEVEIKGQYGLFTDIRVDKSTVPEGIKCCEFQFGILFVSERIELDSNELTQDDFSYTGEELTILEYQANHDKEPDCFMAGAELSAFLAENEVPFIMSEEEATVILNYLNGHDYLLGRKEGRLLRGDLCCAQGIVRWIEYSIEQAIYVVCEWNDDLLDEATDENCDALEEDDKILRALFIRTTLGKEAGKE